MEDQNQNFQLFYPHQILTEFEKKALNHIEKSDKKRLIGCVIGYRDEYKLIGEELLIPKQSAPNSNKEGINNVVLSFKLTKELTRQLLLFLKKSMTF